MWLNRNHFCSARVCKLTCEVTGDTFCGLSVTEPVSTTQRQEVKTLGTVKKYARSHLGTEILCKASRKPILPRKCRVPEVAWR